MMVGSNPVISKITLNVNVLNTPLKTDCQIGLKSKTQLYALCFLKENFF